MVDSRRSQIHTGAADSAAAVCIRGGHDAEAICRLDGEQRCNLFNRHVLWAQSPSLDKRGAKQRPDGECELRFKGVGSDGQRRKLRECQEERLARDARRQMSRALRCEARRRTAACAEVARAAFRLKSCNRKRARCCACADGASELARLIERAQAPRLTSASSDDCVRARSAAQSSTL